MREDGLVVGSVSGGCVEDDLIDRVRKGERVGKPSLINYGVSKEEAARFGLPCGGNLRLVQEPLADTVWIDEVLARTARHELVAAPARPFNRPCHDRTRVARRSLQLRRHGAARAVRPALAFAHHRRRATLARGRAHGAGARLRGHLLRPARRIQPHLGHPRHHLQQVHARRPGAGVAARPAQCRDRRHARPQARRHGAAGGAQVARVLRRRAGLAQQHRGAQGAAQAVRPEQTPRSPACMARSGWTSAARRRPRSPCPSSPRSPR